MSTPNHEDLLLASQLEADLLATGTEVLLTHMDPARKVSIQPAPYVRASLLPAFPTSSTEQSDSWPLIFHESITKALGHAWEDSTVKLYNRSIRVFLNFCAEYNIPDQLIFPASEHLVCAFIALQKETTSKSTINNHLSALKAWHTRNGHSFKRSDRINLIAKASRPLANTKPPRPPVTFQMIQSLARHLDCSNHADAAVLACASTAFWGLARLGELLPTSSQFDLAKPPFPRVYDLKAGELQSLKLNLPWTKVKKWSGETLYLASQTDSTDPVAALNNHLSVNKLSKNYLLFSVEVDGSYYYLTKSIFMDRCNAIWSSDGLPVASGHSFRIGGTSHLLLSGVQPDIIKKAGRWSSDAFFRYWRHLDVVLPSTLSNLSTRSPGLMGDPRSGTAGALGAQLG